MKSLRCVAAGLFLCVTSSLLFVAPQTNAQSPALQTTLTAAGATFPAPLYEKWFASLAEKHQDIRINYDAIGSQGGIDRFRSGEVDFAAVDIPLSDEMLVQLNRKAIHFATVLGAVVPVYNVSGLQRDLRFTPEILAGIYLGEIKKWNDPRIRSVNHGASLPDAEIRVVYRSDGSGTTFVWTDYLGKVSPQWKATAGASVAPHWPVGTGAEHNDGVAQRVQETPNSIGYVEFYYAIQHRLNFGWVRNADGRFIQADLPSITNAAAGASEKMSSDFRVSITNPPGKDAYPISTFTWFVLPESFDQPTKKTAVIELLRWVLSSGQKQCSALGYAPLPAGIAARESQFVDSLTP